MKDVDVLIVGAGPAGNTTSLVCARAGLKVLQIERAFLPRRKICGGGLSQKTLQAIQALPLSIDGVIESWIDSGWICAGTERSVIQPLQEPGAMVCREKLDAFMAEAARAAGAKLLENSQFLAFQQERDGWIQVSTSQGQFRTRILVGADGVHSQVRRQLLPSAKLHKALALEALLKPDVATLEALKSRAMIDFRGIDGGYGWVFPKRDHINVGVYRFRKMPDNLHLKDALQRFIQTHVFLRHAHVEDVKAFEIPIKAADKRLGLGQVLLVGDAAGVGEAFYGEGIYFAVTSGQKAGLSIVEHLLRKQPLQAYAAHMKPTLRDLSASRLMAKLFYQLPSSVVQTMISKPFVLNCFEKTLAGSVSPLACMLATLVCAPGWMLQRRRTNAPLPS